ncbi:tyrosine-type recombinase/integrase [Sphingomonas sp. CROZ-RG-20F-R02-07]|uniref:tyrosine-type recombinase/integrase n=1 Tax=Sphingomonas sp. CROZ-RG-20F-R02-07 TaxID=2914832 RepID=UPI001F564F7E|nr:tyrosine-type recombinase/integrase [Sphingomonas sp. CROZ-RG-20F-R02-07]
MKNVSERPAGSGKLYFRRKIAQKDVYVRLPAVDDPDFAAEYARLSAPDVVRAGPKHGTLAWLVVDYRGSAEWKAKGLKTREDQGRYLQLINDEHGHRSVAGVRPVSLFKMRDKFADTPGKANVWLSVFGSLMRHAIKLGLRDDNPTDKVPILAIGEHEPWPADLLRVCMEEATPMTRLAIVTGLCSGQRISDCVRMQYGWISAGIMEFTQVKKRRGGVTKDVAVPMHPFWLEELAKPPRRSVTLLYERTGAPFKTTAAIQERLRALMAKDAVREVLDDLIARETIAEGSTFTFHGLRKNACCYLVECGLNDSEIGEILGMSPEMVRHYSKRARALMVARGAADRMTGGKIVALPGAKGAGGKSKNG